MQQKNSFYVYITKFNLDSGLIGVGMLEGQMFCLGEAVTQTVSPHDFFLFAFSWPGNYLFYLNCQLSRFKSIAIRKLCHIVAHNYPGGVLRWGAVLKYCSYKSK